MATILVELYRHNRWANLKLLELCAGLSEDQLDLSAPGTYGRVRDTFVHLVGAEERYVAALGGGQSDRPIREDEPFPGAATLREHAERSGAWLIQFAEENPNGKVLTGTWRGEPYRMAAALLMVQAINHATEHRAHVVSILTQHGVDVPPMDGWVFWEEKLIALTSQAPALVLWGDRDPFISPSFAERFGAARVEHFPDYGHWLAIEAPEIVAERLTSFFP